MDDRQSLSHTKWECKYHLVWIPKYRKKDLYTELRRYLGPWFKDLAFQKESQILEGHLKPDHVHMLISIPPKYSGQHFWARGYFVSTVGMDEQTIREYIRAQEKEDRRLDQMNLFQE